MNEIIIPDFQNILNKREDPSHFLKNLEKATNKTFKQNSGVIRTKQLLSLWGNPQYKYPIILISGTAGKGSTCQLLAQIFIESGYKVGTFTSPTVMNFYEQIQINNNFITPPQLVKYLKKIHKLHFYKPDVNWFFGFPTRFESMCAIAASYFEENKVDFAIFEVGLGGLNDATNALPADLSVITNIDYEHTQLLGKELKDIAKHKAGIIKNNKSTITGVRNHECINVIRKECKDKNNKLYEIDYNSYKKYQNELSINTLFDQYSNINLSLEGNHQIKNSILAISCAELILKKKNINLNKRNVKKALNDIYIPARMQIYSENPKIIIDGAHNPCKINALTESLPKVDKYFWLLSITLGKDIEKMIEKIFTNLKAEHEFICTSHNIDADYQLEAIKPNDIKKVLKNFVNIEQIHEELNPKIAMEVLKKKMTNNTKNNIGVITGSLYLISELMNDNTISNWSYNSNVYCKIAN